MNDDPLPYKVKETAKMLLTMGDAELMWLQMGMGLLLKTLWAKVTDDYLADRPTYIFDWIGEVQGDIAHYSRDDLARLLLGWYRSVEDFQEHRQLIKQGEQAGGSQKEK